MPDDHVDWREPYAGYAPVEFTAALVLENDGTVLAGGWADPPDPRRLPCAAWNATMIPLALGDLVRAPLEAANMGTGHTVPSTDTFLYTIRLYTIRLIRNK